MAYGEFYVERQGWARWPKTLVMCRLLGLDEATGNIIAERRRYVPERTCHVECFDDGLDEALDGEIVTYAPPTWYLSCGHTAQGTDCPKHCPECGARIEEDD